MIQIIFYYLSGFVFLYPLFMALFWILGGLFFYFRRERRDPPVLENWPSFSIIIPAHNEEITIERTLACLKELDYPHYEVIVVNDGSTDATPYILRKLRKEWPELRVIHLRENRGKAAALNCGLLASRGEIILGLDADALLEKDALKYFAWHFALFPRVGAVTGNPRVINRTSLLAKIQVGEYSTIIGLIKRTQRILGKILTVSGVVAAYRKTALMRVGGFDSTMYTEDIEMTWRLETDFWDVRYEPRAKCWIFVPETLKGLFRQRLRWACGGIQVLIKYRWIWKDWRQRRLWPVYIEYFADILWAYGLLGVSLFIFFTGLLEGFTNPLAALFPPRWAGALLAGICLLLFGTGALLESKYEKNFMKYYFWTIWYPFIYWFISLLSIVIALPKILWENPRKVVWKSPDRGLGA